MRIIQSFTYILILSLLFYACKDSGKEVKIFNEKNLDGWEVKCTDADQEKSYWYVEDGVLVANSMGDSAHDYIWLQYNEELSDFRLKFKFQPIRGNSGNTGIQVRSRYDENEQWLNGPQIDIHPSGAWRTGMMWDETRGYQRWIFPDLPKGEWVDPTMAMASPPFNYKDDETSWNEMEVIARGLHISAFLNGVQITDFHGEGILNDQIHKNLGVGEKGYILLQIHTGDQLKIRFKDIYLTRMD